MVALVSRSLTPYEKKRPPLEQKLHVVRWALRRCRRFTATSPRIHVSISEPAHLLVLADKTHHLRIEALLVDLASYNTTYSQGEPIQYLMIETIEGMCRTEEEGALTENQLKVEQGKGTE